MASKTLHSNSVTFVDYSDNRQLDVYIASNLPTTQIYNPNTNTYSPDWSVDNLQLSADVFLDSKDVTADSQIEVIWYQKNGTSETQIGEGTSHIIFTNELANVSMLTYICKAMYQGIEARTQVTFTRSDTGLNGNDGTSVNIEGTAYYDGTLTDDNVGERISLYADTELSTPIDTATLSNGDSYIVQGYLCIYNSTDDMFICSGKIQGPQGADAKGIILNADAQIFKISQNNVMTPTTIAVTAQEINTTITQWSYSTNGGKTFLSTAPSGVVRNGNQVNITGEILESNMLVIKASDGPYSDTYTIYKVSDGANGAIGDAGQSAPIAFLTNESISFSADEQGQVASTTVTTNVVAYNGTIKVTPTIGTITDIPVGMTIDVDGTIVNNEIMLIIQVDDKSPLGSVLSNSGTISIPITSPVSTVLTLSWSKINTGATGANGADAVTFQVYSADGYVLSQDTPTITLQTFAYNGDTPIEAGATYQWYIKNETEWVELTEAANEEGTLLPVTTSYAEIHHSDVSFSCSYMCKMIFNGNEYVDVVTIDDKNDTNTVFTSKPITYSEGDIWIVGDDYAPDGVEIGTVLKAQHPNTVYTDEDWVTATKYDDQISSIEKDVNTYKQYISLDTTHGITMNAVDEDGNISEFSTTLSNTQLSFNQADEAVAYINNHKMHITEAEIESPLTVTGKYSGSTMLQAPTINLGSFSFVVESNGSLSIVSNL